MQTRSLAWGTSMAMAAAVALVGCNKPGTASSDLNRDLSRDLDAASSAPALALAPTSGSRDVVSAVEQSPDARRAPAPSRRQPIPTPHVSRVAPPPAQIAAVAVTPPAAATVATLPETRTPANDNAAQSRRPTPVQQQHQGRYKTEAEVFRDAPFPITP